MLIHLLRRKTVGKDVNLEEIIGEYECSKVRRKLCLSQMDRCVMAVRFEVDSCVERDSLEDGGETIRYRLEDGFHTFGTSIYDDAAITRTYTMVYKLSAASKCPCNFSGAKFQLPRCAACKCKGTISNVGE